MVELALAAATAFAFDCAAVVDVDRAVLPASASLGPDVLFRESLDSVRLPDGVDAGEWLLPAIRCKQICKR